MQIQDRELIRTRTTLIKRLKNWQDQASWQAFFDTYWKLIYGVAVKSGLTGSEAQEVVQETMISVAKHMPGFTYDRNIGSFKTWLLTMTRWRITDQFRKRDPRCYARAEFQNNSNPSNGPTLDNVADPAALDMASLWEEEWKNTLCEAAMANVRRTVDPAHYQIFDFSVNKKWASHRIAQTFGVTVGQVYLTKHRVTEAIKEEVKRLKTTMA